MPLPTASKPSPPGATCQLWTAHYVKRIEASQEIHDQKILISYPVNVLLQTLDIVARHRAVADAVNKLRTLVADPQIHRYWDDYAL